MKIETNMANEQAKQIFNQIIYTVTDADKVAKLEICREYFTNTNFREGLEQYAWDINNGVAQ